MKSLFKKFSTAVIVLAAVALLSVPLLGGAKACGGIADESKKKFNHFAAETDKHGNNFESDMVVFAANAESLCDEAARIHGGGFSRRAQPSKRSCRIRKMRFRI